MWGIRVEDRCLHPSVLWSQYSMLVFKYFFRQSFWKNTFVEKIYFSLSFHAQISCLLRHAHFYMFQETRSKFPQSALTMTHSITSWWAWLTKKKRVKCIWPHLGPSNGDEMIKSKKLLSGVKLCAEQISFSNITLDNARRIDVFLVEWDEQQ